MHNYTPEDLICYLYKETSPKMTAAIEKALETDWTLREKMVVLKTSYERLNTLLEAPRTEPILSILKYADKSQSIKVNS